MEDDKDQFQEFEEEELASPLTEASSSAFNAPDDGVVRYATGEPVSKRTLQNRKAQREFRQRRANYLRELEEKVRRYESGQNETTQALQREVIQLREENEYLRSQLARLHADQNLMPLATPLPANAARMPYPAAPSRSLPAMTPYAPQQYPYFPATANSANHLPMGPPHPTADLAKHHRPRSPADARAPSPFAAADGGPGVTSPVHRGRQVSAPGMLVGPADGWTNENARLRTLQAPDPLSPIPPLSATSLRSSTGSPGPTSPHWYPGPPSAGLGPPKSWLQPPAPADAYGGHPGIQSPPTLHTPSNPPLGHAQP